MRRIHFFELLDLSGWPDIFRRGCTSYLQWITNKLNIFYIAPAIILKTLKTCKATKILDLGSGAGGPWFSLYKKVHSKNSDCKIILSDKYPNSEGISRVQELKNPNFVYEEESVDALCVQIQEPLVRTQFFAFHHFKPADAKVFLLDGIKNSQGILIFDGSARDKWKGIISSPLILLMTLLSSPFWKPFRKENIVFSLIPIIPFAIMFDGIVSYLRFYSKKELEEIVAEIDSTGKYQWKIEDVRTKFGCITYISDHPAEYSQE
ncbi:MAG: hypothetical protein AB8G05_10530 [Oligoflexales bacterium]